MTDGCEEREVFSRKMVEILNCGALNLAIGIGYRVGLYEIMDTFDGPQTLSIVAEKAGLNSRYMKEWLGVMVSGGIVEVAQKKDGENTFYLPKAHADILTRRAANDNLGVYAQEIPLLTSSVMEAVVNGFYTGEGINYELYSRFQAFMSELAVAKHHEVLIDKFLPTVDDGKLIERLIEGIRVCDVGCAEGTALLLMAKAFPASRFIGIDLAEEPIRQARTSALRQGLANAEFTVMNAATLKESDRFCGFFNYVTAFDAIHDQTQPFDTLKGIHHVLADQGVFSMVDIAARTNMSDNVSHPMGPFLYTVSLMHCMPVGLVGGGVGLGMMWGREMAVDLLRNCGFQYVEVFEMPHDPFNLHFFCRK
jgi:ubiquinone/menaquinone biosynthesis C-methylase UbiE